jgi:hypothetical protein
MMVRLANKEPAKVGMAVALHSAMTEDQQGVRMDSWNIYDSFLDTNAVQVNPTSENMIIPMHLETVADSITDPANLTKMLGFTIQ